MKARKAKHRDSLGLFTIKAAFFVCVGMILFDLLKIGGLL